MVEGGGENGGWENEKKTKHARTCIKSVHCSLCTDVEVVVVVSHRICIYQTGRHSPFDIQQESILITLIT